MQTRGPQDSWGRLGVVADACNPWGCTDKGNKGNSAAEKPKADRCQDTAVSAPQDLTPQKVWNLL